MNKKYKPIGKESERFVNAIVERHSEIIEKLNDPVFLGMMVAQLTEERENTNRLIKNLLNRIEKLERMLKDNNYSTSENIDTGEEWLPEIDQNIISFVKQANKVTAKDVKNKFKYKGTNAASARLNRLCNRGFLIKKQVGRKVYFMYNINA